MLTKRRATGCGLMRAEPAVVGRFGEHLRGVRGLAPTTVATYTDGVARFAVWLEVHERGAVESAGREDVVAWLTAQAEVGLAPATRALSLYALRSFYGVGGHGFLPVGGQRTSPLVASRSPH